MGVGVGALGVGVWVRAGGEGAPACVGGKGYSCAAVPVVMGRRRRPTTTIYV